MKPNRVICWFSCGVTSTIATKIALEEYKDKLPVVIAYCDTGSEHEDNNRFIGDCENYFGQEILRLRNPKYKDTWDVYEKERYLSGIYGARCSLELKKNVRRQFENLETDIQVFGFDYGEQKRAKRFEMENLEVISWFPLLERKLTKSDCLEILKLEGIEIPMMYKLGYKNNNCIACVKGAKGYWNKIRKDFPDEFERMAKLERKLGATMNLITKNGKTKRIHLDELPENVGNYNSELPISCGLLCG